MPINLDNVFRQTAALADTAKLYAAQNDTLVQGTGLHGIKKLSQSAQRAENIAAAQAFLSALSNDPRYMQFVGQVRAPLDNLINSGKPLTAGVIRRTQLALNFAAGVEKGRELVAQNKLPQGHATAFGQFAAVKGFSLESEEQTKTALKAYYLEEIAEKNLPQLTKLPDTQSSARNAATLVLLKNICSPLTGAGGFFEKVLDKAFAADYDNFAFEDFTRAFETENAERLNTLGHLSEECVNALKNLPNSAEILQTLTEALPFCDDVMLNCLPNYIINFSRSTATAESRAEIIKDSMLEQFAGNAAESVMERHGLPKAFSAAVGHNPEVMALAKEFLAQEPGKGQIPTQDRINEAAAAAAEEFAVRHEADLREFKIMAENPPVDLNPPLTPETMPRYINAMLAGDALLEPLLNESIAVDEEFMKKAAVHAEALNSSVHSFKGDFGADDIAAVLENSIKLLLARRGIQSEQYLEIMQRTVSKFGPLASDMASLNIKMMTGFGGSSAIKCLSAGMTVFRSLEGHAKALLGLMNHDQLAALGLEDTSISQQDAVALQRRSNELKGAFLERNFQKSKKLENLSDSVRTFAESYGISLPPKAASGAADRKEADLSFENSQLSNAVYKNYISETGKIIEPRTQAFRDLFADIEAKHDLTGIDIEQLDLSSLSIKINEETQKVCREANKDGKTVDTVLLHRAVEKAVTESLLEIKALFEQIDALPVRTDGREVVLSAADGSVPPFSLEEKRAMKECIMSSSVRDFDAVMAFSHFARTAKCKGIVARMATELFPASQMTEEAVQFAEAYLEIRNNLPDPFAGSDDACAFMVNMAIKCGQPNPIEAASLYANMSGDTAKRVTATLNWLRDANGVTSGQKQLFMAVLQTMTQFYMKAGVYLNGNAELEPGYFIDMISHPSEMPGGCSGMVFPLKGLVSGNVIGSVHEALSMHKASLNARDWNRMAALIQELEQHAAGSGWSFLLPFLAAASSESLLAAMDKNKDKPLTPNQIWDAMIGGKRPSGLKGENYAGVMLDAFTAEYHRRVKVLIPNIKESELMNSVPGIVGLGITPKKLLELAVPGSSLSLDDIHIEMEMTSMKNIVPETAYGLVTDFARRDARSTMNFIDAQGSSLTVHPHPIDRERNNAANPEFAAIINKVRSFTHSEAQFKRVMQAFSQDSLGSPRAFSQLFPGVLYSEHGNFVMSAQEQADGSVLFDVTTDSTMPLVMHEQFRIEMDGTHVCTKFDMRRA